MPTSQVYELLFTVFFIAKHRKILIYIFFIICRLARHETTILIDSPTLKISDYDFQNKSQLDRGRHLTVITLGPRLWMTQRMCGCLWRGWGGEVA